MEQSILNSWWFVRAEEERNRVADGIRLSMVAWLVVSSLFPARYRVYKYEL